MHTLRVVLGGFVLLGLFVVFSRFVLSRGMAVGARWFIPAWLVAAGVNLAVGVVQAGYTLRQELPIFLLVFAVPAVVALLIARVSGRT